MNNIEYYVFFYIPVATKNKGRPHSFDLKLVNIKWVIIGQRSFKSLGQALKCFERSFYEKLCQIGLEVMTSKWPWQKWLSEK